MPDKRYPTVTALADDLRRYLDHEPVSARADSLAYRASKFVRRYRLAVGAASATLLALLAGVIGTTWQAVEAQKQRDLAQQASREAEVQAVRATASSSEAQRHEIAPRKRYGPPSNSATSGSSPGDGRSSA